MEVFSDLFYILVIGVVVFPYKGSTLIAGPTTAEPATTGSQSGEMSGSASGSDSGSAAGSSSGSASGSASGSGSGSGSGVGPRPGPGTPLYDDCVAYEEKHCPDGGPYFVKARNAGGYERETDICATLSSPCDGGGWTEIGTIPEDEEGTWSHDSEEWTAKWMDQQDLNSQFWSANVSEICLQSDLFNIKIPVAAPSLRSLFFEKRILDMSISDWTDSLTAKGQAYGVTFDPDCYEIGFNVGSESPNPAARLGITSTHDGDCNSTQPNAIGIGLRLDDISGSSHGVFGGDDGTGEFGSVQVYVRSRPLDGPEPPGTPPPA